MLAGRSVIGRVHLTRPALVADYYAGPRTRRTTPLLGGFGAGEVR